MEYKKLTANFFADEAGTREEKIRSAAKSFINLMIESQYEEIITFYKETKPSRYSGQAYFQELKIEEDLKKSIFDIGYNDALLDLMQLYLEKVSSQKEIDGVKTKYKDDILRILMEKRIMFHKDLAGAIGVSASGLTAVIKQMNATSVKLINIDKISKFTLYSLTPAAYQYVQKSSVQKIEKKKLKKQKEQKEIRSFGKNDFYIEFAEGTNRVKRGMDYIMHYHNSGQECFNQYAIISVKQIGEESGKRKFERNIFSNLWVNAGSNRQEDKELEVSL